MRQWIVFALFFFECFGTRAQSVGFADLYTVKWANGIDSRLVVQAPNKDAVVVGRVPKAGGVMMRSCMERNDDFSKVNGIPRAEVAFDFVPRFSLGSEYEISWSTYIPDDYKFDGKQPEIVAQLHQSSNLGSPPFALMLWGSRYRVEVRGAVGPSFYLGEFGNAEEDRGRLTSWALHYRPDDTGKNALVELYRNGKKVFRASGYPDAYAGETKAYLKLGLYKWWWRSRPSDVTERCLYYGDVTVRSKVID
jgi:hypothetical protein